MKGRNDIDMYSRSLDPRRVSQIPNHYSGSAFRPDGTPTPIPVKREHSRPSEAEPQMAQAASPEVSASSAKEEAALPTVKEAPTTAEASSMAEDTFLTRFLGNLLPDVRDDDILLILLLFLLSRESGNEDVLLLLALLLFGK